MFAGHKKQWFFLKNRFNLNQLSHAYLFSGIEHLGKITFAKNFIKLINCEKKLNNTKPCERCVNCQAIEKQAFPDFMLVEPNAKDYKFGDGGEIKISQIKKVQNFLNYKSYYGSFKTVVIDQAEKMNQEAQSCLLKTLEEPKGKTLLILISSKPEMLLGTIVSRCQNIKFFPVKLSEILNWLKENKVSTKQAELASSMSDGRPGLAYEFAFNPEKINEEKENLQQILNLMGADFSEKFKFVKNLKLEKTDVRGMLISLEKYMRFLLFSKIGIDDSSKSVVWNKELKKRSVPEIKENIKLIEDINNKLIFTNVNAKLALEVLLMSI